MAERKKQTLLTGAGVLAIATVIVKLIGAVYKIPLMNLLSPEGYGYFTGAYAIYNPLYAISMAGLPIAVSKLVSQNMELGRIKDSMFHKRYSFSSVPWVQSFLWALPFHIHIWSVSRETT